MKTDVRSYSLFSKLILLLVVGMAAATAQPQRAGWWKFDDTSNVLAAETGFGGPLQLVGAHQSVPGPAPGNSAVRVGIGSHYRMTHGIAPNGGGARVNHYSLQFDFRVRSLSVWHAFFQTTVANNNDGDCFINPTGFIGVAATGYTPHAVAANEWYRLVISVNNGSWYRYYIDGTLILEGTMQSVDGRFSLDSLLLVFADENGEDNEIDCAELAIWNTPLTSAEVHVLGGYGHSFAPRLMVAVPYLQAPTPTSVHVCWHDELQTVTAVEYGPTPSLGARITGTSEVVSSPYRWHTVKLTNLTPNTAYYYRCLSGGDTSDVYTFKTLPPPDHNGRIRFLLFSDTQDDSVWTGRVVRAAKAKVQELYGNDIHNQINLIMHTGDIVGSGSTISQYTDQHFRPFAALSPFIPTMITPGNHELEHAFFYAYVKYDEFSAFPAPNSLNEKIWSMRIARVLFVGLNTNNINGWGGVQRTWLELKLLEAENDSTIDFVFCFLHHPPISELWGEGNTSYVNNEILGTLKNFSKVQQLSYGHTHGYERGVIESQAVNAGGDFRILCGGGGGGARDRWGQYTNQNYQNIHIALDHYFFVLFDIDLATRSWQASMYDLGNQDYPLNTVLYDRWHRRLNQPPSATPSALVPTRTTNSNLLLRASPFVGSDSVMSSQFQVTATVGNYQNPFMSVTRNWQDIFGVDASFNPVDRNLGIDLASVEVTGWLFNEDSTYGYRVRYRDRNLRWSNWSNELTFVPRTITAIENSEGPLTEYSLAQNYPNPFNPETTIRFTLPASDVVSLKVYDVLGRQVATLVDEPRSAGEQIVKFDARYLSNGVYYYRLTAGSYSQTRKLMVTK